MVLMTMVVMGCAGMRNAAMTCPVDTIVVMMRMVRLVGLASGRQEADCKQ
jgi:hypothetical protein